MGWSPIIVPCSSLPRYGEHLEVAAYSQNSASLVRPLPPSLYMFYFRMNHPLQARRGPHKRPCLCLSSAPQSASKRRLHIMEAKALHACFCPGTKRRASIHAKVFTCLSCWSNAQTLKRSNAQTLKRSNAQTPAHNKRQSIHAKVFTCLSCWSNTRMLIRSNAQTPAHNKRQSIHAKVFTCLSCWSCSACIRSASRTAWYSACVWAQDNV